MSEFLNDDYFERFRSTIYNASGIHFSSTNRSILESRLKDRVRKSAFGTVAEYYDSLRGNESELKSLLDSVTTNLTRFFRNKAHVQTFEYHVVPELVRRKEADGSRKITVWSAGCSTGEEPYTLAMLLQELLPPTFAAEIVASDLSLKSLMSAQQGYYPESKVSGVPEKYLSKYFEKKTGGYQVRDELKRMIRFDYHNLKHDSGLRNLDVIMCRNVLIYFDEAAQKAAVDRFWDAFAPFGFLFIGHSESLFGMKTRFDFLRTEWACIYKKDTIG
ncbi:MAG: protein-glutamate O-methyltransferase CheR [Spirochaetales bacterium]|nr:MAG: protein-glutamate O-methyltransferase CheR [Spirochaetales bacterium]